MIFSRKPKELCKKHNVFYCPLSTPTGIARRGKGGKILATCGQTVIVRIALLAETPEVKSGFIDFRKIPLLGVTNFGVQPMMKLWIV